MTSSLKCVGLTALKATKNCKITNKFVRTSSDTVLLNFSVSKFKTVTTNTSSLIRKYHQLSSIGRSNRRAIQQQQLTTTVKLISSSKLIKGEDNTRSLSSFHKYKNIMDAPPGIFNGSLDRFNGVTVFSNKEFNAEENFAEKLCKSLEYWRKQKRRCIWFYVKTEHSEWVPHLTKMNFEFHHAKNGMVILNHWLPEDECSNCPVYAHTMLGVGGLVVNENNEILVVTERTPLIRNSWKLPGGYVEPNENIVEAAIREVREETGIECIFNTVVSIRHSHKGVFGCSDIYCVVALTPTTFELQRCAREIAETKWMPCNEYLQHPDVHETNRHFLKCFLDYKKRGIRFTCEVAQHQILKKEYCLFYMKPLEEMDINNSKKQVTDEELGKV